jgi:predicted 3-demethylubiquinone-9 3-methyltransferase (glyoxalase superfamily)
VSWQIVPVAFMQMMLDADTSKSQRAMQAMFTMKKLDIAELERAFAGQS